MQHTPLRRCAEYTDGIHTTMFKVNEEREMQAAVTPSRSILRTHPLLGLESSVRSVHLPAGIPLPLFVSFLYPLFFIIDVNAAEWIGILVKRAPPSPISVRLLVDLLRYRSERVVFKYMRRSMPLLEDTRAPLTFAGSWDRREPILSNNYNRVQHVFSSCVYLCCARSPFSDLVIRVGSYIRIVSFRVRSVRRLWSDPK